MENMNPSADPNAVAVPSFAELVGETPSVDVSPQPEVEQPSVVIDWDAEKTRWETTLAEKEAALAQTQAQFQQLSAAAQQVVAQQAAQERATQEASLDAQLDNGDITPAQYRAEMKRTVAQERAQLEQQVKHALLPVWTQEYAASKGLTADETKQLSGVPMEAVEWTVQTIVTNRERDRKVRDEIEQLKRSMQAQGVVQQGVTRTATGAAAGVPASEFAADDNLGRMRSALSGLGHLDLIGARD